MTENVLFPEYIHRPEEIQIRAEVARVQDERQSRVVLLYGPGGVGKTRMIRELGQSGGSDGAVKWINPIDVDDSEYWLLSTLERHIMRQLDPENRFFRPYTEYLTRLPTYLDPRVGHETIVSHLGRIKQVFAECYKDFIDSTGTVAVIVFDTVETIRGMYLLLTLTQWMKKLPATLFILVGRPMGDQDEQDDPIRYELADPHQGLPVTSITLGDFPEQAAREYLAASLTGSVTQDELEKLVRLSRGHPLWLAFTVAYLRERGVPEEAETPSRTMIEREIPYSGQMSAAERTFTRASSAAS